MIKPSPFYNRTSELKALERAWTRARGQMLLLYGRRRLGKTFLLQRYVSGGVTGDDPPRRHCYYLAEQTTALAQRTALARELLTVLPSEGVTEAELAVSWNALLRFVSQAGKGRRLLLILDEFPYLLEQSPELASTLQAWWDREGVHAAVMVVLCGSQLSVMAALGRESAPLFGRFNAGIFHLDPLSHEDVARFYQGLEPEDVLLLYGVFGGTPRYHAMVDITRPVREEIVTLLMQPRAVLENEIRFLLGSEQIREPAPYNAVLAAIAGGDTQAGRIQNRIGVERGTLSFYLRTLQELGWIYRELPFGETSERRALYRIADPFLAFWYRFVAPNSSAFQFSDPHVVFAEQVEPHLADYMGRSVFEDICKQWLQRHARERLGVTVKNVGRYWSRDGSVEIDLVADVGGGRLLYGECKWRTGGVVRLGDLSRLQAKVAGLGWKGEASYVIFSLGGFSRELVHLATEEPLYLVSGTDLVPPVK